NTPQAPRFGDDGAPFEYAVKMRRFDESARLDRVCARGELRPAHLSALAQTLCDFHTTAAVAPADSRLGSPAQVMAPVRDNFAGLQALLPGGDAPARLVALQRWSEAQFEQLQPQMAARQRSGHVRECHGDLHLANLVLLGDEVRLFDCLEFDAALRWIDVASETAFPYVDLLAHDQPGLAHWFVNEVWSRNGDYEAAALLRFYAVYRAMVRAKVAAIRASQTQADATQALAYLALAERLAAPATPRLTITHGLSGCGKTYLSDRLLLSDAAGPVLRLRSDVERKRLFGLDAAARSGSATDQGIYAASAHERTYARLHELAAGLLRAGWSVIVDATFLKRADRARFHALAQQLGLAFVILAPQASPAQLRERILARRAQGRDASEATLEVLARQMQAIEPLTQAEQACVSGSD
ncbi:MAG: AAA family ATPase, partial [Hylemonella sp.]|nr:AAA family ATPase [Hylemonella sp.]